MAQPEAYTLARYRHWRVFGTGTFSGARVPTSLAQRKLMHAFLYRAAKTVRVPFRRLVWCYRHEHGELGGREHYHWLLGAEEWTPNTAECFVLNTLWDKLPLCGFSRNYLFNQTLNGIEYVTKCLHDSSTSASVGGAFYESTKFSSGSSGVTLSNSLARVTCGRRVGSLCAQTPEHARRKKFW